MLPNPRLHLTFLVLASLSGGSQQDQCQEEKAALDLHSACRGGRRVRVQCSSKQGHGGLRAVCLGVRQKLLPLHSCISVCAHVCTFPCPAHRHHIDYVCELHQEGYLCISATPSGQEAVGLGACFHPCSSCIALCGAEMLSTGNPAPHIVAEEGPLVGCTHQVAPEPALLLSQESKAPPACMLAVAVLLSSTGLQPLTPSISPRLLYPVPSRMLLHSKEPWGWVNTAATVSFYSSREIQAGVRKKTQQKQTCYH